MECFLLADLLNQLESKCYLMLVKRLGKNPLKITKIIEIAFVCLNYEKKTYNLQSNVNSNRETIVIS